MSNSYLNSAARWSNIVPTLDLRAMSLKFFGLTSILIELGSDKGLDKLQASKK